MVLVMWMSFEMKLAQVKHIGNVCFTAERHESIMNGCRYPYYPIQLNICDHILFAKKK